MPGKYQLAGAKEVASKLAVTEAGLRWQIHQGTAPRSAIINGRRMWVVAEVDAFIEAAFASDAA